MQVPEVVPQAAVRGAKQSSEQSVLALKSPLADTSDCYLIAYPGEPCELLVQLENRGSYPLRLEILVDGDFPSDWYRIGTEGEELPPLGKMEAVLYFQVPADFFESQEFGKSGEPMILDYQSRVYGYYTQQDPNSQIEGTRKLIEPRPFNLYVRPRSLYLDFLPEIYREVDFIGRLLKIFEQAFEPDVEALNVLWAYLDPLLTPQAILPFLAHWVGWPLTKALTPNRQRYLIRQAMELYRWRGTKRGLRLYLHLFTDLPLDEHLPEKEKHICIEEVFGKGFVMGEANLGQGSIIGGGQPYHFMVTLRPDQNIPIDETLVRQIITQEKPAFCTYELYIQRLSFG
ncbi:MAG: phage tail protein [Symploca sp. SIO2E6]|nr:phage tail protein [Symploca sp. SIO2E6]